MAQEPAGFVPDGFVPDDATATPVPTSSFPSVDVSRQQSRELPKFTRDLGALEPYRPLIDLAATGVLMGPLVGMAWKTLRGAAAVRAVAAAGGLEASADVIGVISPRAAHALRLAGKMLGKGGAPATAGPVAAAEAVTPAVASPAPPVAPGPLSPAAQTLATRTGTGLQPGVGLPRGPSADYYGGRPGPRLVPPAVAPAPSPAVAPAVAPPPMGPSAATSGAPPPQVAEPPWVQPPPEQAQAIRDAIARNRAATAPQSPPVEPAPAPGPPQGAQPPVASEPPTAQPEGTPAAKPAPKAKVSGSAKTVVAKAAKTMGVELNAEETTAVARLVMEGNDPQLVIKLLQRNKAAAELAKVPGFMTEHDVHVAEQARARGQRSRPGVE